MFALTCESTADLPISYLAQRRISALPYTYCITAGLIFTNC